MSDVFYCCHQSYDVSYLSRCVEAARGRMPKPIDKIRERAVRMASPLRPVASQVGAYGQIYSRITPDRPSPVDRFRAAPGGIVGGVYVQKRRPPRPALASDPMWTISAGLRRKARGWRPDPRPLSMLTVYVYILIYKNTVFRDGVCCDGRELQSAETSSYG